MYIYVSSIGAVRTLLMLHHRLHHFVPCFVGNYQPTFHSFPMCMVQDNVSRRPTLQAQCVPGRIPFFLSGIDPCDSWQPCPGLGWASSPHPPTDAQPPKPHIITYPPPGHLAEGALKWLMTFPSVKVFFHVRHWVQGLLRIQKASEGPVGKFMGKGSWGGGGSCI